MGLVVLLFLVVKFAIYAGFFFLISKVLDIGTPMDSLRAALHRTWLGAAATIATLVVFIFLRFGNVAVETNQQVQTVVIWLLRAAVWIWVTAQVYRVTRWRKWKLAVVVLAGLALNAAIDIGLYRLQGTSHGFMPSFGHWEFRLC
jgi:hypothetical protein